MNNNTCQKCNKEVQPDWAFCVYCRNPLRNAAPGGKTDVLYKTKLAEKTQVLTPPRTQPVSGRAAGRQSVSAQSQFRPTVVLTPPRIIRPIGEDKVQVIDVSSSMSEVIEGGGILRLFGKRMTKLDAVKKGLAAAVGAAASQNDGSRMAIVAYSAEASVVADLTPVNEGKAELLAAVEALDNDSKTNIAAGLEAAASLQQWPTGGSKRPMRITLFSDGWDTADSHPVAVADRLKKDGVFIETIGFGAEHEDVDERTLKAIASVHHGKAQYRFFTDPQELVTHITRTGITRVDY